MLVFSLASLWCGLASSGTELIVARVAQGVGAPPMSPAARSDLATSIRSLSLS